MGKKKLVICVGIQEGSAKTPAARAQPKQQARRTHRPVKSPATVSPGRTRQDEEVAKYALSRTLSPGLIADDQMQPPDKALLAKPSSKPENPKTTSTRHSNPALSQAKPIPMTDNAVDMRCGK